MISGDHKRLGRAREKGDMLKSKNGTNSNNNKTSLSLRRRGGKMRRAVRSALHPVKRSLKA